MSTQFTNRQWRLPNNENKDKQSNYSMDFDGTNDYIDVGNPAELQFGDEDFTITSWFKMPTSQSNNLVGKFESSGNQRSYAIWIDESGSGFAKFVISNNGQSGSGNTTVVTDNNSLSLNNWHFVAVVYDSTNNLAKISVDGNSFVTASHSGGAYSSSTANFRISNINAQFFEGQIDGVAIFNYALSSSQITTLYGSSSTGIGNPMSLSPKPVAYYPLGDQDAFNGANYLVPNSSLKDYVFDFNNSQEINCGNNSSLQMDTVFTMSCWINTTSTSRGSIFGTYISNGYYIDLMASGTVQGGYHSTGSHFLRPSSSTVNDGNWHHVCYVISGTATDGSDLDVYIDGQLNNGSFTSSGTPSGAITTNPFKINLQGYAGRYTGKTSNVQIFNSALSSTDVETLYNNGSPLTSMSGYSSLQAWWKLDASATYDSSTTTWTIEDSSTNSNDGTSSGMTQANLVQSDLSFKTSYSPYALSLDGTDDYINCGNISALNNLSEITISFWYKFNGTDVSNGIISQEPSFLIQDYANIFYFYGPNNAQSANVSTSTFNYKDGNWHNFVWTYKANDNMFVYINGVEYATTSTVNTNLPTTSNDLNIGRRNNGQRYAEINISNVSIWNTALTSAQVSEIYSEGIPQNLNNHSAYSNLISWWQLGSNSSFNTNWTVLDEKGSNNGTSANMGEDDIVDGVGSYANGVSSGMSDNIVGDAFGSSANSLSYNMDVLDRSTDVPN